jgi:hypothetical protein
MISSFSLFFLIDVCTAQYSFILKTIQYLHLFSMFAQIAIANRNYVDFTFKLEHIK